MVDIAQVRVNNTEYNFADDTKVPYDLLQDTVGWTAKNLIPFPHYQSSITNNGVTITVNADGSVTVNGTATATVFHLVYAEDLFGRTINFENTDYILSGCPEGGSERFDTGYHLDIISVTHGSDFPNKADGGNGVQFSGNALVNLRDIEIRIRIQSGVTVNNLTFYPMLRKADIMDSTYEQYNPSVKQVLRNNNIIEGKNLIPFPYTDGYSRTTNGITFTVNSDGSITANGTSTNYAEFALMETKDLQDIINKGDTFLSLSGTVDSNCIVYCRKTSGYITVTGNSYVRVPSNTTLYDQTNGLYVQVRPNATVNNIVFKPMLRKATETDPTYEQYYIPGVVSQEAQNVLGAKNLLLYSQQVDKSTDDGITPTFNSDGTVTVNGTATKQAWCVLMNLSSGLGNALKEYAGKSVIFNGGINENMYVSIKYCQVSGGTTIMKNSYGNDVAWVIPEGIENYNDVQVLYTIISGTVCNNKIFKPMLRLASVKDSTYAPPSLSNNNITKQLTIEYLASSGWTINKLGLEYGDNFKNKITSNDVRVVRYGKLITVISDSNFSEEITTGNWQDGVYIKNLPKPNKIQSLPGIFGYISDPDNMIGLQLHERNGVMQLEFVKSYTIPAGSRVRFNFTYIANI